MKVAVGDRRYRGRGIDLRELNLPADAVAAAVRGDAPVPAEATDDRSVRVACPDPGPVHERVGVIRCGTTVSLTAALAAAARSRGHEPPEATSLREARERLAALPKPSVDLESVRRQAAAAGESERQLKERVASLRGRVQTLRERDDPDASDAEAALAAAVRELTEVETERHAASQRLERAEENARAARDARERRLKLEDRVNNLERAARQSLAATVHDEFATAVRSLPGDGTPGERAEQYEGDPVTAALAVVRVAKLSAPVVLDVDRFDSAGDATDRLDAAVVLV
jgi:hypothetical protein